MKNINLTIDELITFKGILATFYGYNFSHYSQSRISVMKDENGDIHYHPQGIFSGFVNLSDCGFKNLI